MIHLKEASVAAIIPAAGSGRRLERSRISFATWPVGLWVHLLANFSNVGNR